MKISAVCIVLLASTTGCLGATTIGAKKDVASRESMDAAAAFFKALNSALSSSGEVARVSYHEECLFDDFGYMVPPKIEIHAPAKDHKGLQAVQEMVRGDPNIKVSEDSGIVRISIGDVSKEFLSTRFHSVKFNQVAQFNPRDVGAVDAVEDAPDVKDAMARLKVTQVGVYIDHLVEPPLESLPHLPPTISDMTVNQAYDLIAKTFHGVVLYGECTNAEGQKLIDIEFNYLSKDTPK